MRPYTLDEVIKENYERDRKFAKLYDKERLIVYIATITKEARENKHLTQRELAIKAGTTQAAISRLESGQDSRIPSLFLLSRIAKASGSNLNITFN